MSAPSAPGELRLDLPDEAATARLGEDLAAALRRGDLIRLSGGLGAGKSSLARALIRSLAADPAHEVASPSFAIRIDHALPRLNLAHADLYRLAGAEELEEIGLGDAVQEGALIVEWPELLPADLTTERLDICMEIAGAGRQATLSAGGSWPERLHRTRLVRGFLDASNWAGAMRLPLAGDASSRAYERILRGGESAILMNAPARAEGPPLYGGRSYDSLAHRALDVRPFLAVGAALRQAGVRTPAVHAADTAAGLVLLEDLGDEGILDAAGRPIIERYAAAVDVLAALHRRPWQPAISAPGQASYTIPLYDRDALLVEISLFPDWFGGHGGEPAFPSAARADFLAAWSEVLATVEGGASTLVMRDFHSPNILWQAGTSGVARVGVLDFQDALIGHPAYDVASLAQDARAPLTQADEEFLKARYRAARRSDDPGFDTEAFDAAYAILAAQRATKVLGAFTRLALAEGKPGYQRHRERLKALLRRTLAHPVLSGLRLWYEPYI